MEGVSLGLGAKVAKLTLSEFLDLLKEHNVKLNIDGERALRVFGERICKRRYGMAAWFCGWFAKPGSFG